MKKFLFKIFILSGTVIMTYFLLGFLADGYIDAYYLRFTTPKQKSMIIGTSRAAQGIQPKFLNNFLNDTEVFLPIFNFSFTILHSPYGEIYFNAIKAKLDETSSNGLFIVTVDPWSISSSDEFDEDREKGRHLDKVRFYNLKPNYDYLLNSSSESMFNLLLDYQSNHKDPFMVLQNDGWLKVNADMDSTEVKKRTKSKIKDYTKHETEYSISKSRINWLEKTVELLNKHGKVVLVRIPVSKQMLQIENKLAPNFDAIIKQKFSNLSYLNYAEDGISFRFTDGHHLYKKSGDFFSKILSNDIKHILVDE